MAVMRRQAATAGLMLLLIAACSVRRSIHVSEPMLPCGQATRAAREALERLGYSVITVEAARPDAPGRVIGTRDTGWAPANPETGTSRRVTIGVRCSDTGAEFEGVADEGLADGLSFPARFSAALKETVNRGKKTRPGVPTPPPAGVLISVEPRRSGATHQDFGIDLTSAGVMPVKFEIHNHTTRRYRFRHDAVVLVTQKGDRLTPLSAEAASRLVAPADIAAELSSRLGDRTIPDAEIAPGAILSGYLYFKAAAYQRARVILTDAESDEHEGFLVEF